MLKYGNAAVVNRSVAPGSWIQDKVSPGRVKIAKQVIGQHDPKEWLLTHVSIVASVDCDYADPNDKKSNYLIRPEHEIFVNNNGDSWERSLLEATYKTFLKADNFVEHVQIPELSKGKILDVAIREVPFAKDKEGNDITSLYVDILIATNRKHKDLVEKIESGEYSAVSMGCLIKYSQCSQCGNIAADETEACKHVKYYKGNHFYDKNGVKRIVAELCGRAEDPDSCTFIDASWVHKPAFEGAVLRNIVSVGDNTQESNAVSDRLRDALKPQTKQDGITFNNLNLLSRAASTGSGDIRAKSAHVAASQLVRDVFADDEGQQDGRFDSDTGEGQKEQETAPLDDTGFPEAPEDANTPLAEEGQADTPMDLGGLSGDLPQQTEAPAPEQPAIQEPVEDATSKEVKDMFKRQILNDIRRDLLKEQAKTTLEDRPVGVDFSSNESLVKDASASERLINGIALMGNLKDISRMSKYGYSREDVLGILHFIDQKVASDPLLPRDVKALSKIKLASDDYTSFFTEVILETGHKPSRTAAKKMISWANLLHGLD